MTRTVANFSIDPDQLEWLRHEAAQRRCSMSQFLRWLIEKERKRTVRKKKARQ